METITLGTAGRETTRLGYGCSSLMGTLGRKESLALLESAFDAGLRHFDVAPMYGFGQAESCVGEFLNRHRAEVTVTTKYGIPSAKRQGLIGMARSFAGPVIKALPGLKSSLLRVAARAAGPAEQASFSPQQAKDSLHRSLTQLHTDRIDVWLLHEVDLGDLRDHALLGMLEESVAAGSIGTFGVGSERTKVETLAAAQPAYCRTVQFEWSVMDAPVSGIEGFRIHHRSLSGHFPALLAELGNDPAKSARWSEEVGGDIRNGEVLASLMLKAALTENSESIVLVSSKNPKHLRHNVAVADDKSLETPARRLRELVRGELAITEEGTLRVAG